MKIRPLFERMIIEVKEVDRTKGGIVLPQDVSIQPVFARVLAKGQGMIVSGQIIPIPIDVGETIIIDKREIETIELDGQRIDSCRISAVMGVIEP